MQRLGGHEISDVAEALAALIDFFFNEVKANRLDSRHDPRNPNSGKVMLKCGLQYEGTVRQGDWCNQGVCDYAMYGILREDYLNLMCDISSASAGRRG